MKVLQVHNRYRVAGGEDSAFDGLVDLLRRHGIEVAEFTKNSLDLGSGWVAKLKVSTTLYSRQSAAEFRRVLDDQAPDIVHVHNVFPMISPSIFSVCKARDVPVIMTCHNYRMVCAVGTHFRDGAVCELCAPGREYWCALKNCRGNLAESAVYAARTGLASRFGLFRDGVSRFIALSQFQRQRIVAAGCDAGKVDVLPNPAPLASEQVQPSRGEYAAFVGRISPEKGVPTLLQAAARVPECAVRLAGDAGSVSESEQRMSPNTEFVGLLPHAEIAEFYAGARFVVVPSVNFEGCPMVILEAMAHGLPVIASRLGGLPELVEDGVTGLLFEPGNADDLAAKLRRLWSDPCYCSRLGAAARQRMVRDFNESVFVERLLAIYRNALGRTESPMNRSRSVA